MAEMRLLSHFRAVSGLLSLGNGKNSLKDACLCGQVGASESGERVSNPLLRLTRVGALTIMLSPLLISKGNVGRYSFSTSIWDTQQLGHPRLGRSKSWVLSFIWGQPDISVEVGCIENSPYENVEKVTKVLDRRYTLRMLIETSKRETMRHRDYLDFVPSTTLGYRLRELKEAGLITSRQRISSRPSDEYYLTRLGTITVHWLLRVKRMTDSPPKTKKIEDFKDIKVEFKDATK